MLGLPGALARLPLRHRYCPQYPEPSGYNYAKLLRCPIGNYLTCRVLTIRVYEPNEQRLVYGVLRIMDPVEHDFLIFSNEFPEANIVERRTQTIRRCVDENFGDFSVLLLFFFLLLRFNASRNGTFSFGVSFGRVPIHADNSKKKKGNRTRIMLCNARC